MSQFTSLVRWLLLSAASQEVLSRAFVFSILWKNNKEYLKFFRTLVFLDFKIQIFEDIFCSSVDHFFRFSFFIKKKLLQKLKIIKKTLSVIKKSFSSPIFSFNRSLERILLPLSKTMRSFLLIISELFWYRRQLSTSSLKSSNENSSVKLILMFLGAPNGDQAFQTWWTGISESDFQAF